MTKLIWESTYKGQSICFSFKHITNLLSLACLEKGIWTSYHQYVLQPWREFLIDVIKNYVDLGSLSLWKPDILVIKKCTAKGHWSQCRIWDCQSRLQNLGSHYCWGLELCARMFLALQGSLILIGNGPPPPPTFNAFWGLEGIGSVSQLWEMEVIVKLGKTNTG